MSHQSFTMSATMKVLAFLMVTLNAAKTENYTFQNPLLLEERQNDGNRPEGEESKVLEISRQEFQSVEESLEKFHVSPKLGIPPKIVEGSLAMELRNSIARTTTSIFTINEDNEASLILLAQEPNEGPINVGKPSGMGGFTFSSKLNDLGCFRTQKMKCSTNENKYRTITGICNNLKYIYWGSASIVMRRYVAAQYADGFSEPRGARKSAGPHCETGNKDKYECCSDPKRLLPNPRLVSFKFHPHDSIDDDKTTHLFTQFGQFLDHDITLTPESPESNCCTNNNEECFPIHIPLNCSESTKQVEADFPGTNGGYGSGGGANSRLCLHFARSLEFCHEDYCAREQMNGITAFIDASNVYGSNDVEAANLRNGEFLRTSESDLDHLPIMAFPNDEIKEEKAGDGRAREMPGLAAMHTIFLREHNKIVSQLTGVEKYQRARRILGCEMQVIVYNEYLPVLLGDNTMSKYKLWPNPSDVYNEELDPSIRNSFATAAFRFGHSMIAGLIQVFASNFSLKNEYKLRNNYFDLTQYYNDMEGIIRGLLQQNSKENDRLVNEDLTDFLFANKEINGIGSDLVARNIQRGRDHGIPGYNDFREFCGMKRACSWQNHPEEICADKWKKLSEIYDSPSDIDLFTGGLSEDAWNEGIVGRTFNCLIADQFRRLKFGDRFFCTSENQGNPFDEEQLQNLLQRRLGDIICDNTNDIPEMRENVFLSSSPWFKCENRVPLKMELFN